MHKRVQRHPASFWDAHSFMRNRTNGSDFSLCMGDPGHRSLVLLCADLTTGKECSWSLHRYDFS